MSISDKDKQTIRAKLISALIGLLENVIVKKALIKFIATEAMGGFRAWLVKFVTEELFEQIARPIIMIGIRRMGYGIDIVGGEYLVKKLKDAKDENNQTNYDHAVDDILN